MRDDFKAVVKDLLAKRVGMKCSNPNCRRTTSGPQEDPKKVLNVGVAAHIAAASKGGPRYDTRMSSQERKSEANGSGYVRPARSSLTMTRHTIPPICFAGGDGSLRRRRCLT